MKRPNRTVSIFTLSALDVLAMSTGVFVLLVVLLMPYYRKTFDANAAVAQMRVSASETLARIQSLEENATLYRGEAEGAEKEASRLNALASTLEDQARANRSRMEALDEAPKQEPGPDPKNMVVEAIDLVFVIDTTSSMTPALQELSVSMRSIVRILERLVPSVRIGVAAYTDRDTGLPPVTVMPMMSTDHDLPRILNFVNRLDAARVGSPTVEEDLHLGLAAAFAMRLRPTARQAIVVIGDAAAHKVFQEETLIRSRNFVRTNKNRTVSTLFVTTPSSLMHGQRDRHYFQLLADAGNGSFNDHAGSMTESILLSVLVN
jgi:hypothetical protein